MDQTDEEINTNGIQPKSSSQNPDTLYKKVALDIYGLVQMAMQTGPLTGSNAGYFKRCGWEVAQMALDFLNSLPSRLYFRDSQSKAIEKWRSNAQKALDNPKPPSKSMLKRQKKKPI